jgi:ubiquinone/menaquinone biosynthesis C-methylase UbiE
LQFKGRRCGVVPVESGAHPWPLWATRLSNRFVKMSDPKVYSTIARLYDVLDLPFEYWRYRPLRKLLWQGVNGRLLDAGIGTGRNIEYYPTGAEMVGIDLSGAMLKSAAARQARLGAEVDMHLGNICETAFEDQSFDAIVSSFLFCVLDDQLQLPALRELRRLCKPDGEIRILEYAYSKKPVRRVIMNMWAPWVQFAYGARFDRDTGQYAGAAGLKIVEDRFVSGDIIRLLVLKPA